jgi:hypothetical protein
MKDRSVLDKNLIYKMQYGCRFGIGISELMQEVLRSRY